MAKKDNALMTLGDQQKALAALDPRLAEMLGQSTQRYMGNVAEEDVSHPRMLLLQGQSAFVTDHGMPVGTFAHSISRHPYTAKAGDGVTVIPIFHWTSRLWLPDPESGETGIICQSKDGKTSVGPRYVGRECRTCPHAQWKDDEPNEQDRKPDCDRLNQWAFYVPDAPESERLVVYGGRGTAYKVVRKFNNRLNGLRGAPFFHQFRLSCEQQQRGTQKWWVPTFEGGFDDGRYSHSTMERPDWEKLLPQLMELRAAFEQSHGAGELSAGAEDDSGNVVTATTAAPSAASGSPTEDDDLSDLMD